MNDLKTYFSEVYIMSAPLSERLKEQDLSSCALASWVRIPHGAPWTYSIVG